MTYSESRSHEMRMLLLIVATIDNWLFSMNSPHQTMYVLTWRSILLRGIAANIYASLSEYRGRVHIALRDN